MAEDEDTVWSSAQWTNTGSKPCPTTLLVPLITCSVWPTGQGPHSPHGDLLKKHCTLSCFMFSLQISKTCHREPISDTLPVLYLRCIGCKEHLACNSRETELDKWCTGPKVLKWMAHYFRGPWPKDLNVTAFFNNGAGYGAGLGEEVKRINFNARDSKQKKKVEELNGQYFFKNTFKGLDLASPIYVSRCKR